MELKKLEYKRAQFDNIDTLLNIIHRCIKEVNYKDYTIEQFQKYLAAFTQEWLKDIIENRHYYEVWYENKKIA